MPAMSTNEHRRRDEPLATRRCSREHVQPRVGHADDADVRLDRRERVVRREHVVLGQRVEQRGLARRWAGRRCRWRGSRAASLGGPGVASRGLSARPMHTRAMTARRPGRSALLLLVGLLGAAQAACASACCGARAPHRLPGVPRQAQLALGRRARRRPAPRPTACATSATPQAARAGASDGRARRGAGAARGRARRLRRAPRAAPGRAGAARPSGSRRCPPRRCGTTARRSSRSPTSGSRPRSSPGRRARAAPARRSRAWSRRCRETLGKVEGQLRELEHGPARRPTPSLTEQVGFVRATSEQLRVETASLVTALRAPQARGRWGELQLRRVVEMAGMVEHVDFDEQASVDDRRRRAAPRPGGAHGRRQERRRRLEGHARRLPRGRRDRRRRPCAPTGSPPTRGTCAPRRRAGRQGVLERSSTPTPEFVVLFVPGEAFLAPALEHEPDAARARHEQAGASSPRPRP